MLRHPSIAAAFVAAALFALPALAFGNEPIRDCVELGADRALRHNGAQFLYVRNGEDHYRAAFARGSCNPMTTTSKLSLVTEGAEDRLCPAGTKLRARGISCEISQVEPITGEDYARRLRRR